MLIDLITLTQFRGKRTYLEGPQLKLGGHVVQPADHKHITLQHHVTSGLLDCLLEHSTCSLALLPSPPAESSTCTAPWVKQYFPSTVSIHSFVPRPPWTSQQHWTTHLQCCGPLQEVLPMLRYDIMPFQGTA